MQYVMALDQGTSSSRSIVVDQDGHIIASAQQEFRQRFPQPGWVEHDPAQIWQSQLDSCRQALHQAGLQASQLTAIGVANQRETTLVWHRATGEPIYNAIVWQDRRTHDFCRQLHAAGHAALVQKKTGLDRKSVV